MPARRVPTKGAEHIMGATVETRDPLSINDMGNRRYRIRRCGGNKTAWMLVLLRPSDGTEIDSNGGWTTGHSIDRLLQYAGHLTPLAGNIVELVI